MVVGICDNKKINAEPLKTILQEMKALDRVKINVFNANELIMDVEEELFDCDVLVVMINKQDNLNSYIDMVQSVNRNFPECQIIYISENLDCISYIYETNHVYFLLKQDAKEVLPKAIEKAKRAREKQMHIDLLELNVNGHKCYVPQGEIIYIERDGRSSVVVTKDNKYRVYNSLSKISERLNNSFVRVNGSFIINMNKISKVVGNDISMENADIIQVGRTFEKSFKEKRQVYIGNKS